MVAGYLDQALQMSHQALSQAQRMSHYTALPFALNWAAKLHQFRREGQAVHELTD